MDADTQVLLYEIQKALKKLRDLEQTVKNIEATVNSIRHHQKYEKT